MHYTRYGATRFSRPSLVSVVEFFFSTISPVANVQVCVHVIFGENQLQQRCVLKISFVSIEFAWFDYLVHSFSFVLFLQVFRHHRPHSLLSCYLGWPNWPQTKQNKNTTISAWICEWHFTMAAITNHRLLTNEKRAWNRIGTKLQRKTGRAYFQGSNQRIYEWKKLTE